MREQRAGRAVALATALSLSALQLALSAAAPVSGAGTPPRGPSARLGGAHPLASLDIRLHPGEGSDSPPGHLLLSDPAGRKSGWDSGSGEATRKIPHSSYVEERLVDAETGTPGPTTLILYVRDPIPGAWKLRVLGRATGTYSLEVHAVGSAMNPSSAERPEISIEAGEDHAYTIRYSLQAPVEIQGSFEREHPPVGETSSLWRAPRPEAEKESCCA